MSVETSEQDQGPHTLYRFLRRIGFLDTVGNQEKFHQWMEASTFQGFEDHLVRVNGLVRQMTIKDRGIDGKGVSIQNQHDDISYLPPRAEDKNELMEKSFDAAKNLSQKDAGLLLYYSLQAIHPFADGNGRTGRLLCLLMEKSGSGQQVTEEDLVNFLAHDGESGPGRERFAEKVESPEKFYPVVESLLTDDIFGPEIRQKFSRIYSGLQVGAIESFSNEKLTPETMEKINHLMSEGGGGNFAFRNIVLMKYVQNNGPAANYVHEDIERKLLRFDGQKILEQINESQANEIVTIDLELKKQFVEKIIDIVTNSEKYTMQGGGTLKDQLYLKK